MYTRIKCRHKNTHTCSSHVTHFCIWLTKRHTLLYKDLLCVLLCIVLSSNHRIFLSYEINNCKVGGLHISNSIHCTYIHLIIGKLSVGKWARMWRPNEWIDLHLLGDVNDCESFVRQRCVGLCVCVCVCEIFLVELMWLRLKGVFGFDLGKLVL